MSTLVARPAPPCLIADMLVPPTAAQRGLLYQRGVRAFGRYLENLTAEELAADTGDGFGVLLIGESRAPGWWPSVQTGQQDAQRHLARLAALAIPVGPSVIDDFETPDPKATQADCMGHVDTYAQLMGDAGYLPAPYVGAGVPMTGDDWQARPGIHRYAKSCSRLRDYRGEAIEPMRGWSWIQGGPPNYRMVELAGDGSVRTAVTVDVGLLCADYHGDTMMLVYDQAHAP